MITLYVYSPGGHNTTDCNGYYCLEGNMDIQYISGIAQVGFGCIVFCYCFVCFCKFWCIICNNLIYNVVLNGPSIQLFTIIDKTMNCCHHHIFFLSLLPSQDTVSIFWYVDSSQGDDPFLMWATAVAEDEDPPRSNSISWAALEFGSWIAVLCVYCFFFWFFGVDVLALTIIKLCVHVVLFMKLSWLYKFSLWTRFVFPRDVCENVTVNSILSYSSP